MIIRIDVLGGVASLESDLPKGIDLIVHDYDNELFESKEECVSTSYEASKDAEWHPEAFEAGRQDVLSKLRSMGYPDVARDLQCAEV